jgi:uncharacterized protein YjbJ (UPF0337 family)
MPQSKPDGHAAPGTKVFLLLFLQKKKNPSLNQKPASYSSTCPQPKPHPDVLSSVTPDRRRDMNEDRAEGTVREFAGKAQSAAGDLLGDSKSQAEGRVRQAAGQAQEAYGAASDSLRGLGEELTDRIHETPLLAMLGAIGIGYLIGRLTAR